MIIPAILESDLEAITEKLGQIQGSVARVQLDVCDGVFVPNKSWPYIGKRVGAHAMSEVSDDFASMAHEETSLPFWQDFDFDIDLMVKNPEAHAEDWISAGASMLIFHIESNPEILTLLQELRERFPRDEHSVPSNAHEKSLNVAPRLAIAINLDTPDTALVPYIPFVDAIQCMGIAKIGFQGQAFDPRTIDRVKRLSHLYPHLPIMVDGGVSADTASDLLLAGAQNLVVGSAIWNNDIPTEALLELEAIE